MLASSSETNCISQLSESLNTDQEEEEEDEFFDGSQRSQEFYEVAHEFMILARPFRDFTLEDSKKWIDDIDAFDLPEEFPKRFPYYLAGYDFDGRPVWVVEAGKYNIRWVVEQGRETMEAFEKFGAQAAFRMLESMLESQRLTGKIIRDVVYIIDFDAVDYTQFFHLPTMRFALRMARKYQEVGVKGLYLGIGLNVGYLASIGVNMVMPFLPEIVPKCLVYGPNQAEMQKGLRERLPEETIPTWYGGREDYKPLQVYNYSRCG